jgi:hypothetical protein
MKTMQKFIVLALCACALGMAQAATTAEPVNGNWTLRPSEQSGKVQFGIFVKRQNYESNHSADWPAESFQGVDFAERGKRDVHFRVAREAGQFDCEGYLNNGVGAGVFLFTPDSRFASTLSALGFDGVDAEKQFAMANVDVTSAFAKQMKAAKLSGLDTDKLIGLRIFDVTPEFIAEMRAEGLPMTDSDNVIAFRVHGVNLEQVRELRKMNIQVTEDRLISFRVHKVTPEFAAKVADMGFKDVDADQLVAMRVHGVTPEYVKTLRERGVKDLTVDKLIALRVHGIK